MARNFSASLNSAFAIDDSTSTTPELNNLAQSVSEKKAAVDSQTSELQALEARIKEMDKRLEQKRSRTSSPAGVSGRGNGGGGTHEPRRSPLGDTFGGGGSVNAPGAAGNYYGTGVATGIAEVDTESRPSNSTTSPLADRTINVPSNGEQGTVVPDRRKQAPSGGAESLSASTRNRWMPSDGNERGSDI